VSAIGGEVSHQQTSVTVLRRRMETEKVKILEDIDNKNETELLLDVEMFWKRAEVDNEKREKHSRRLKNVRERIQQETLQQG
jgi:hypothetical protein